MNIATDHNGHPVIDGSLFSGKVSGSIPSLSGRITGRVYVKDAVLFAAESLFGENGLTLVQMPGRKGRVYVEFDDPT